MARDYELVLILKPEAEDSPAPPVVDRVQQFIQERGGQIVQTDHWGRRKLAYPIAHYEDGEYIITHFLLDPPHIRELENNLHLSEDVIRHLIVKLDN